MDMVGDAVTLLLPAREGEIAEALGRLKVSRLLEGYRGASAIDQAELISQLQRIAAFVQENAGSICELEINPLFVGPSGTCAVDVLLSGLEV